MNNAADQVLGAKNLLLNCAGLKSGESLLIISERPDLGWYDGVTADFISDYATRMGVQISKIEVGRPENVKCPKLSKMIDDHDCTIFFSRIGDQDRFSQPKAGTRSVMCYIRDMEMLASAFGTTDYNAVRDLKNAVDKVLFSAQKIEITCPLGTRLVGTHDVRHKSDPGDVGVLRFPLGVPTPIPADGFSGRIVMDRYLAPTGSRVYDPPYLKLEKYVYAEVENGRIIDFWGPECTVKPIKEHYERIANEFGIDPNIVHSWHAGIHPGCQYKVPEEENPDRWSNTVFCHPTYVHFHTCGDYAPGEISCTLPGHTISINGMTLWRDGKLLPHIFEETMSCIRKWSVLSDLFGYSAV